MDADILLPATIVEPGFGLYLAFEPGRAPRVEVYGMRGPQDGIPVEVYFGRVIEMMQTGNCKERRTRNEHI